MVDPLRAYARATAGRNGIDPERFVRQIQQESGFDPNAHNDGSGADGIAQIVVRWHPAMAGKTRDPYASLDYAAGLMRNHLAVYDGDLALALSCYNAGPGATAQGLKGTLNGWPYAETVRYVANILQISQDEARRRLTTRTGVPTMPTRVTFNVKEPAHIQEHDYDCSQDSLEWALHSLGRKPDDGWLDSTMQAEGVMTRAVGLMDASGHGLASFVKRHYGEFGFDANNENPVSFDALVAEIGPYPILIGGRGWGHWSGLWGYDRGQDLLLLANPSPGWHGVGQTMSRQQFASLGPFSLVRVLHPDLLTAAPEPPAPPPPVHTITRADFDAALAPLLALRDRLTA